MAISKENTLNRLDRRFFSNAMKKPLLSREKETQLAKEWLSSGNKESMHEIINSYSKLVIAASSRFRRYGLPVSDLVQEGHIGLMQAISKFEPEREIRFSTYASWWIRSAMQDYVLRNWSIVRTGTTASQKALFFSLRRIKNELGKYGYKAHELRAKVAEKLNIKNKDVEAMESRFINSDKSLNAKVSEEYDQEFGNYIVDDKAVSEEDLLDKIELSKRKSWFYQAMNELEKREFEIIKKRHISHEPMTLEKLGKFYNISKERVRQIESRAIKKLTVIIKKLSKNTSSI